MPAMVKLACSHRYSLSMLTLHNFLCLFTMFIFLNNNNFKNLKKSPSKQTKKTPLQSNKTKTKMQIASKIEDCL